MNRLIATVLVVLLAGAVMELALAPAVSARASPGEAAKGEYLLVSGRSGFGHGFARHRFGVDPFFGHRFGDPFWFRRPYGFYRYGLPYGGWRSFGPYPDGWFRFGYPGYQFGYPYGYQWGGPYGWYRFGPGGPGFGFGYPLGDGFVMEYGR
jgi:hypothetical protein